MTTTGKNSSGPIGADNLQESVESWITNLDSLELYSLDRVLSEISRADLRNINLHNLFHTDASDPVSDVIVSRDPTTGEILDFYEQFVDESSDKEDGEQHLPYTFDEDSVDLLLDVPTLGHAGIDFLARQRPSEHAQSGNLIDLSQALYTSKHANNAAVASSILDESSLLDVSSNLLDESSLLDDPANNTADRSVLDIINQTEDIIDEAKEGTWWRNRTESSGEKVGSSPSMNDSNGRNSPNNATSTSPTSTGLKKKKKYAVEPDAKAVKNFDEIKSKLAHTWPFELDNFQKQAVYLMENSECVFVAAHTSAGKTVVAEYAIALSFKHKTKVIYTSPIKALSNQKFREFKAQFEDVGLITGDIQIAPEASCLIMTTEILRSMLYRRSETLHDLEWVIFDEVHYMNDAHRGVVWEEVLILLPDHINIVMLSATIPNHLEFAEWVGKIKQRTIYVTSTRKRPVPLEHYLYTGNSSKTSNELFLLIDSQETFLAKNYNKAVEVKNERAKASASKYGPKGGKQSVTPAQEKNIYMSLINMLEQKQLLPVVVFTFSRKRCDDNIDLLSNVDLTTSAEKSHIHTHIKQWLSNLNPEDQNIPQIVHLTGSLKRGVGVHHSGILPIMKEIIELLFQRGLIRVLFATETFAMGINMPARTVVFDSLRKHDGTKFRALQASEYIQMAGRAGRRGLDSTGTVIVLCKNEVPDMRDLQEIMKGRPQQLESKFRITYSMILSLLRKRDMRIQDFMRRSFSEHKVGAGGGAEDPAVYEAASIYLRDKLDAFKEYCKVSSEQDANVVSVDSCAFCGNDKMGNFFDACDMYADASQELFEKLQVHAGVYKVLQPGRVVFVKSVRKLVLNSNDSKTNSKLIEYKLAPVILLEAITKDSNLVLGLCLDELVSPLREQTPEEALWDEEEEEFYNDDSYTIKRKLTTFYSDRINSDFESLIEKLKQFRVTQVQAPLTLNSLAIYENTLNSTIVQLRFKDIQAISTKVFQKTPQLNNDFSFTSIWYKTIPNVNNYNLVSRTKHVIQNLNKELSKNGSFTSLSLELLRYTEYYSEYFQNKGNQSLAASNFIMDFVKDLNIRDIQFAQLLENYKLSVNKLSQYSCFDCPRFKKHFDQIQVERSIEDRIRYLHDVISGNSLLLVSEYRYRFEALKKLRLIDDRNFVLLKGKVALEISMSELLITEMIIENVFSQMAPAEIVSLLSAIVYQQKSSNNNQPQQQQQDASNSSPVIADDSGRWFKASFSNATLDQGRDKMLQIAQHLNEVQQSCGLQVSGGEDDYLEQLNFGLVNVVHEWCKGVSFVQITTLTDTQEGIIVRTIQRLDELCHNLKSAARIIGDTVLESKIEQCSVLIRRDIIFAASLYTK